MTAHDATWIQNFFYYVVYIKFHFACGISNLHQKFVQIQKIWQRLAVLELLVLYKYCYTGVFLKVAVLHKNKLNSLKQNFWRRTNPWSDFYSKPYAKQFFSKVVGHFFFALLPPANMSSDCMHLSTLTIKYINFPCCHSRHIYSWCVRIFIGNWEMIGGYRWKENLKGTTEFNPFLRFESRQLDIALALILIPILLKCDFKKLNISFCSVWFFYWKF